MHRRYENINIPTEILRTVVVISQTGNFAKAGEKLNLSQPAITAQIKRLQTIVGGPVFSKSNGTLTFTDLGKTILSLAARLLELNDQIIHLGGSAENPQTCRVGISDLYIAAFLDNLKHDDRANVAYTGDHSTVLTKGYNDGFLDVVCLRSTGTRYSDVLMSWDEPMCWVRSPSFVQRLGKPIPLVSWPGDDQPAVTALEKSGQIYSLIFTSPDHRSRYQAVAAGLGIMATPVRSVIEPTFVVSDPYLPSLPPMQFTVLGRPEKLKSFPKVLDAFKSIAIADNPASPVATAKEKLAARGSD
jgi:DNA-binding transcriptional LysR family regulator